MASCRWPCVTCATRWTSRSFSSPTSASTSTPTTGSVGSCAPTAWSSTTTQRSSCTRVSRSHRPRRGPPTSPPAAGSRGQGAAIRAALDGAGRDYVAILAYAAKYASALYGPFREAVDVTIAGDGDRKGYQQDSRNRREAMAEVAL